MILQNKIYCGDNVKIMKGIDNNTIDLTITSPPYDDLRAYEGFSFDFKKCSEELYRITKPGGVVVWVVGDSTKNGSESGTSFRQALYFVELGFNLHDTMIYKKHGMPTDPRLRYYQRFDYMFVLSKGKPKSYNPIADVKSSGRKNANGTDRKGDVLLVTKKRYDYPEFSIRGNIWEYDCRNMGVKHPAAFPEGLANDHIVSWSKEGDLVLDPFCGSGTTCKMALVNKRNFIGIDISSKYCSDTKARLKHWSCKTEGVD
jgi:DNA modification methylase